MREDLELEYELPCLTLMYDDVSEQLPDVTDEEMKEIAQMLADSLMDYWAKNIRQAIIIIKKDRNSVLVCATCKQPVIKNWGSYMHVRNAVKKHVIKGVEKHERISTGS